MRLDDLFGKIAPKDCRPLRSLGAGVRVVEHLPTASYLVEKSSWTEGDDPARREIRSYEVLFHEACMLAHAHTYYQEALGGGPDAYAPGIVPLLGIHESHDQFRLYQPYCSGDDLAAKRGVSFRSLMTSIVQAADSIGLLHCADVAHNDVKAENILYLAKNTQYNPNQRYAMLIDLGLAARRRKIDGLHRRFCTDEYASPQRLRGELDPCGDVYGLAATLYFVVTGAFPYIESLGDQPEIARSDLITKREDGYLEWDVQEEYLPHFPLAIQEVVSRALSPEMCYRPSWLEFRNEIAMAIELEPTAGWQDSQRTV